MGQGDKDVVPRDDTMWPPERDPNLMVDIKYDPQEMEFRQIKPVVGKSMKESEMWDMMDQHNQ